MFPSFFHYSQVETDINTQVPHSTSLDSQHGAGSLLLLLGMGVSSPTWCLLHEAERPLSSLGQEW